MSAMTAEFFLDANILLYVFSNAEEDVEKRNICQDLLLKSNVGISTQVIQEFINTALRKPRIGISEDGIDLMMQYCCDLQVVSVSYEIILNGLNFRRRYRLSHWDSTIVAAALEMGCGVLYSEDLNHGQVIEGVTVVNPFVKEPLP